MELRPGAFRFRPGGEFTRGGRPVAAPIVTVTIKRPLAVMKHQVTAADYARCVKAEACPAVKQELTASDVPAVDVSWRDARAYAAWLSRATGVHYRLPTDEEWAYAAASRFNDDALPDTLDGAPLSERALAIYDRAAGRDEAIDTAPRPVGSFGANENGLLDMASNVWEWTDSCYMRTRLNARNEAAATVVNCGIRVVEGRHRSYMADFVRDARAGGCAVGTPPSNLGFRLVRDESVWRGLRAFFGPGP